MNLEKLALALGVSTDIEANTILEMREERDDLSIFKAREIVIEGRILDKIQKLTQIVEALRR